SYGDWSSDVCSSDLAFKRVVAPESVAAVIVEPVQGEGGFIVPPLNYLRIVQDLCRKHGIVFIADEVQSGIGRSGKWFASEHFGKIGRASCREVVCSG